MIVSSATISYSSLFDFRFLIHHLISLVQLSLLLSAFLPSFHFDLTFFYSFTLQILKKRTFTCTQIVTDIHIVIINEPIEEKLRQLGRLEKRRFPAFIKHTQDGDKRSLPLPSNFHPPHAIHYNSK